MTNKKILIIAPIMFHYHQALIDELSKNNQVLFFADQPRGALTALKRKFSKKFSRQYYDRLFSIIENEKLDYFLCINGKGITREFISKLRNKNRNAKFITYQWDSLERNNIERKENYLYFLDLFDSCFSFDPKDVTSISKLEYLPTYHNVDSKITSNTIRKIDFLMVASYTKDRYQFIRENRKEFENKKYIFFHYLYLPWHHYMRNLILKGELVNPAYLKFKPLSKIDLYKLYTKSKTTIDIQYIHQSGFTMRIMEGLAFGCKILTTNRSLTNNEFNKENIEVFKLDSFWKEINSDFLNKKFTPDHKIEELHIRNWIKRVFR